MKDTKRWFYKEKYKIVNPYPRSSGNIVLNLTTKDFQDAIVRELDPDNKLLLECILEYFEEKEKRYFRDSVNRSHCYMITLDQYKALLEITKTEDKEDVNE